MSAERLRPQIIRWIDKMSAYMGKTGVLRAQPFEGEHEVRPYIVPPKSNPIPSSDCLFFSSI